MLFKVKWIELEIILLLKISQTQKVQILMFSLICGIQERAGRKRTVGGDLGSEREEYLKVLWG